MKRKYTKVSLLAAGLLALSSCDVAIAEMSNASDDAFNTQIAVDNNTLQILYDLVRDDESFNSEIAEMLTYEIAKNYLGNYTINEIGQIELENWDYTYNSDGSINDTVSDDTKLEFIKNHQAYWNWTDAGIRITYEDEGDVTLDNIESYTTRINAYKDLIKKQVVVTMFDNINVDTYKYNSAFYEILYVKELMESYYSIYSTESTENNVVELSYSTVYKQYLELIESDYEDVTTDQTSYYNEYTHGVFINSAYDPEKDYTDIIDGSEPLIHLEHYVVYINNEIIPTILNNLLTELYIFQNQYAAIGRTQQRKIEYVQITNNTANDAYNLLSNYLKDTLAQAKEDNTTITEDNLSFEEACTAWQGVPEVLDESSEALAKTIAEDTFGALTDEWQNTTVLVANTETDQYDVKRGYSSDGYEITYIDGNPCYYYEYYEDSLYGDLIADYSTLTDNPLTNNTTNYETFTSINDRTYDPETGLEIQTNALKVEDYTTYGWGTRSDYSDLPDSITERLFSASIINELNSAPEIEDYAIDWTYIKTFQPGGVTFLKKSSYNYWNEYDSVIWSNDDGTSYYLVAVYDYVTPSKTTSSENTAEELAQIEEYAVEVGYEIASGSTYTSVALEYFLENSYITYFDQDVYDYFVETYPDLFEY